MVMTSEAPRVVLAGVVLVCIGGLVRECLGKCLKWAI